MAKNAAQDEKRYFVAVVPPEPLRAEITGMKGYFKEKYHASKALNSPPHITLHMPFKWKEERENEIASVLSLFCEGFHPFRVKLAGFGAFEPRVIFVQPVENPELSELQKKLVRSMRLGLNLFNGDYKDRGFHPHLTLAFRDLKKAQFAAAWEEFQKKNFEARFEVNSICLLKHIGHSWIIFKEFPLSS